MPAARQLCRASNTVGPVGRKQLTACPLCSSGVTPREHVWVEHGGQRVRVPVVPAHARNEHGEMRTKADRDRNDRPWAKVGD